MGAVVKTNYIALPPHVQQQSCSLYSTASEVHEFVGVCSSRPGPAADVALHEARGVRPRGARETPATAGST